VLGPPLAVFSGIADRRALVEVESGQARADLPAAGHRATAAWQIYLCMAQSGESDPIGSA
jgi:hypothetical protein